MMIDIYKKYLYMKGCVIFLGLSYFTNQIIFHNENKSLEFINKLIKFFIYNKINLLVI